MHLLQFSSLPATTTRQHRRVAPSQRPPCKTRGVAAIDWVSIAIGAVAGAVLSTIFALIAVSVFQARIDAAIFRIRARAGRGQTDLPTVTGIWLSRYEYTSDEEPYEAESEHYVVLRQSRGHIVGRSLSKPERSFLTLDLELEGSQLTGRWREMTSKRRLYRGALQLELDETRTSMSGVWVGFARNRPHQTGSWRFERVEHEAGRAVRKRYENNPSLK
jgi:hypothetical protein